MNPEAARVARPRCEGAGRGTDGCSPSLHDTYNIQIAKDHRVLARYRLFQTTRFPVEEQRPDFYCPWGAATISTGPKGKAFPLYKA